jgi:hypothetical protein
MTFSVAPWSKTHSGVDSVSVHVDEHDTREANAAARKWV